MKQISLKSMKKNLCLQTFLWGVGLSFLFFIPWMIYNHGYFFFYGDFNVQQIPFYQMIHDSVQSGNIGWSYTTDLGANIIGSYSFYMIGSPFFWLTSIFPSSVVPYLMAPMLMLKFGLAAMCAYLFLRRYVREQKFAMFGALLYAFSGFGIYNIFFNHFHEAMITFPLMLAAFDMYIYDNRKGVVGASVFLAAAVNYYFFAGQAVFIFIYWLFRLFTKSYKMSVLDFIRMVFEILVGFLAAGIVIVPSIFAVLQNSRVNNFPYGWEAVVYSSEQRYLHIIESFFFPPDMPAYANFTPDSNAKWASVAGWLPLFSMAGVFTFGKMRTNKWLRKFIPFLFVMALVPILNSTFQFMNSSFYARWYYMLTMMLSLATIIALDRDEADFKPAVLKTAAITIGITALVGLIPKDSWKDTSSSHELGLEKYPDRFWIWVAIAFVSLAALVVVLCLRKNKKLFIRVTAIVLSVLIVGYANVLIGVGVLNASYKYDHIAGDALNGKGKFDKELKDIHNVRSDFYEDMDNMGMFWQIPTIQAFQSIVPGSVMDFYKSVGVERSVASRPETDVYGIRSLLSVKYLFDYNKDKKRFKVSEKSNQMPGYKFLMSKNNYKVYENQYYIPYGFTYDEYITTEEYDNVTESDRHLLLLKTMVLSKDQARKYSKLLKHSNVNSFEYTEKQYFEDCKKRKENVCTDMKFENSRFSAKFTAGKTDELVFFSIPYEPGWSAQVNGQPAEIERVNVGFMAVKVPAGKTSEIVFSFTTPGIGMGAMVSGAGIVLYIVYMFVWKDPKKKRSIYMAYIEDDEKSDTVTAFDEQEVMVEYEAAKDDEQAKAKAKAQDEAPETGAGAPGKPGEKAEGAADTSGKASETKAGKSEKPEEAASEAEKSEGAETKGADTETKAKEKEPEKKPEKDKKAE